MALWAKIEKNHQLPEGSSFQGWAAAFHLYRVFALLLSGASQGALAPGCQTIARLWLPD